MNLPSFPLVKWFAAAEGRFDISLSHSDCQPISVSDVLDGEGLAELANFDLGYGTFAGLDELRRVIADQYSTLDQDDILVFSGASEAIYTFMRTNLSAGDEVIVQSPIFNSLRGTAEGIGCKIVEWRPNEELACDFDPSQLARLCSDNTKLIVFNFPHNPSGQTISETQLQSIVETARKHDAMVFSDEQFRLLELPSTPRISAACDLYEKAVSVTSVSKTYGMGGLRIGWLATRDRDVIGRAREYRYYTTEMTNTPCQLLATEAIRKGEQILSRNRSLIESNAEKLAAFCQHHSAFLRLQPPKAGTMALVEQHSTLSSTEFCDRLLDQQRVFLVPGASMGLSDRLLRFGFGRSDFSDGLERLGRFLQSPTAH